MDKYSRRLFTHHFLDVLLYVSDLNVLPRIVEAIWQEQLYTKLNEK